LTARIKNGGQEELNNRQLGRRQAELEKKLTAEQEVRMAAGKPV
jgi:hypothetical protein